MATKKQYQETSIGLNEKDRGRLAELSRLQGRTKTEVAREAIRWYMDNYEQIKSQSRESETAQAIRYATDQVVKAILSATDRICGMLARQGAEVGTLYELTWRACGTPEAKEQFTAAANTAKQRQRTRLDADEKAIAERTKKVVTS
jgi:predicted DNA-binding protein